MPAQLQAGGCGGGRREAAEAGAIELACALLHRARRRHSRTRAGRRRAGAQPACAARRRRNRCRPRSGSRKALREAGVSRAAARRCLSPPAPACAVRVLRPAPAASMAAIPAQSSATSRPLAPAAATAACASPAAGPGADACCRSWPNGTACTLATAIAGPGSARAGAGACRCRWPRGLWQRSRPWRLACRRRAATGAGAAQKTAGFRVSLREAFASALSRDRAHARVADARRPAAEDGGDDVLSAAMDRGDEVEAGRARVAGLDAVGAG